MPEAIATWQSELTAVLLEPGFQLCSRRLVCRGNVLREKLHFLRHAPLNDCVAFVQTHNQTLTIQDLFLDFVLYHRLKLFWSWRAMPLSFEVRCHRAKLVERKDNLRRRLNSDPSVLVGIESEEHD